MTQLLVVLTYVVEAAGLVGIVAGFIMLVRSGPDRKGSTTYSLDGQQISRAEYLNLRREQESTD